MSPSSGRRTRRSVLTAAAGVIAALAGCATGYTDPEPGVDGNGSTTSTAESTSGASRSPSDELTPCPDREDQTTTYDADAACTGYRLADLVVAPPAGERSTVTVRIIRLADGATRLDGAVTTQGDSIQFQDPITDAGRHRITVALADGPSATYVWDVPEGEAETDAYGLGADVEDDRIVFTEIVQ